MAKDFHDLARLAQALLPGPLDTHGLASKMQIPPNKTRETAARALDVGIVASDGPTFALTQSGAAFARSLDSLVREAREISRERFNPDTGYIPKEWSIE